ncbi:SAM-dependent methyltransferase [Novosphingobium kunmingense]|nr:cyclopropane-fatty-acyl-phospholipid synthase family protein [Novosphingobium kunmingense]
MTVHEAHRGKTLVEGGSALALVPRWLGRLWAGGFNRLLDRVDAGLEQGLVRVGLPDGTIRQLGGRAPGFEAEVTVHDWRALLRLATAGSVGCYQGWEAGDWSSPDPVTLFALFCANAVPLGDAARSHGPWRWVGRLIHRLNRNSRGGAARNIHAHYDLGNDFYAAWLDPTMIYSSAIFGDDLDEDEPNRPRNLHQFFSELSIGQNRKCDAIDRRLALRQGDRLLEIGAGWGTLAAFLAEKYDADVVGLSLSDEQIAWAREHWKLTAGSFDYRKQDYRDMAGTFDAVVSVEMVEAVGQEYWPDFFDCLDRNLKPGGRAVLQYIAIDDRVFPAYSRGSDFIQTYIFPGGMLVSESAFRALAAERGLQWTDQHDFGLDYAETLYLWRMNFDEAVASGAIPDGFDDRFIRLWRFYLMYCEGGFRGGLIDVAQVTLIKPA